MVTLRLAVSFLLFGSAMVAQESKDLATLRYIDLKEGTGAPAVAGKKFTVHYTGWLKDGTKFDSSLDRKEPFQFVQGRRQVISGWDVGFEGMKVGGRRRLTIPYQFAYGEAGSGPIPAKAELTFEVELLDVTDPVVLPPAVDVLIPLRELETKVMTLAKNPAMADLLLQIEDLTLRYLKEAEADALPPAGDRSKSVALRLAESFAALRKELEASREGSLRSDANLFGTPTTRRGIFTSLLAAIAEVTGKAEMLETHAGR